MAIFDRIIHKADRSLSFLFFCDISHLRNDLFFYFQNKTGTDKSEVILQSQF